MADETSNLELRLERLVDISPHLAYRAWTEPKLMVKWFTPAPWKTVSCDVDLRPGGKFNFVMQSPEGVDYPNEGCILEVVPDQKIVWTDFLGEGFAPREGGLLTAIVTFEKQGEGTKYTARALHKNIDDLAKHKAMGFHEGWGRALDQLVDLMKKL